MNHCNFRLPLAGKLGNLAINQPGMRQMTEEQKKKLEQKLWDIANTLRGKMNADEFRDTSWGSSSINICPSGCTSMPMMC